MMSDVWRICSFYLPCFFLEAEWQACLNAKDVVQSTMFVYLRIDIIMYIAKILHLQSTYIIQLTCLPLSTIGASVDILIFEGETMLIASTFGRMQIYELLMSHDLQGYFSIFIRQISSNCWSRVENQYKTSQEIPCQVKTFPGWPLFPAQGEKSAPALGVRWAAVLQPSYSTSRAQFLQISIRLHLIRISQTESPLTHELPRPHTEHDSHKPWRPAAKMHVQTAFHSCRQRRRPISPSSVSGRAEECSSLLTAGVLRSVGRWTLDIVLTTLRGYKWEARVQPRVSRVGLRYSRSELRSVKGRRNPARSRFRCSGSDSPANLTFAWTVS